MNKTFILEMLEEALKEISNIKGVKHIKRIEDEIGSIFDDEVTVLYNKQFELVYNKELRSIELRTTFSNQIVSKEYMDEMMWLYQKKGAIEMQLQVLHKMAEQQAERKRKHEEKKAKKQQEQ